MQDGSGLGGSELGVGLKYTIGGDSLLVGVGYLIPSATSFASADGRTTVEQSAWDVKASLVGQW